MSRLKPFVLVAGLAAAACGGPCSAQDGDRARIESEAIGQAAEADRLFKKGDFATALSLYEAERESRAALGDHRYEAYAARAAGCCQARLGQFDAAIESWNAARLLDAKREDRGFEGYDWYLIADVELRRARPKEALEALTKALPLLSKGIDRDHEADVRRLLAVALTDLDRPQEAGPHLDRALELAHELKDPKRVTEVLAQLGRVALRTGRAGAAAEWLTDARLGFHGQGQTADAAEMDRLLGDAMLALGRPDVASACVDDAADAHERLNDSESLADDFLFLGALKAAGNDLPAALVLAGKAVDSSSAADDSDGEIEALVALAHYQGLSQKWNLAGETLARALEIARRDAQPLDQARLLILAADVELRAQRKDRGRALLDEAEPIARAVNDPVLGKALANARLRAR
jgi:tetratricopeptide (TPR) repeat protein